MWAVAVSLMIQGLQDILKEEDGVIFWFSYDCDFGFSFQYVVNLISQFLMVSVVTNIGMSF